MALEIKDQTRASANVPKIIPLRKGRYFLGKVHETFESTDQTGSYKIKFDIVGLPAFTENWPISVPAYDSTQEILKGDLVLIEDIEDEVGTHTFVHHPIRQYRFTGLKNYDNIVDITEKDEVNIKYVNTGWTANITKDGITITTPSSTITVDKTSNVTIGQSLTSTIPTTNHTGNINITGNVVITGALTVSSTISATGTITSSTDVTTNSKSLKSHTHNYMDNSSQRTTDPPN